VNAINFEHFSQDALKKMPNRYRARFVNSLSGYKSANLIATQDTNGKTNLAIFSSVVHLGANPALIGFIMRPDNNDRETLNNIISTTHYTINQVSTAFYRAAHQSSARYESSVSEFNATGLSPQYIEGINAPFVEQSQLKYGMTLREILPIKLNNTQLIIGEISHVICAQNAVQDDGYIDIESLQTVSVSGLDSYHRTSRLARLSYAKPEMCSSELNLAGLKIETGNK